MCEASELFEGLGDVMDGGLGLGRKCKGSTEAGGGTGSATGRMSRNLFGRIIERRCLRSARDRFLSTSVCSDCTF
jgi:hypothetical protein